jgi:hypothetical protein
MTAAEAENTSQSDRRIGGAEGDRTPDLRIANATLSQLSYGPISCLERFATTAADYGDRALPCQGGYRHTTVGCLRRYAVKGTVAARLGRYAA